MKQFLLRVNLMLRALLEVGIVTGCGYWGYRTGTDALTATLLAIGAPATVFGFWGLVDFRRAGRFAEPLRFTQELAVSFLAAAAVYRAGQPHLGWALAGLSIIHHLLIYALGDRLLKQADQGSARYT